MRRFLVTALLAVGVVLGSAGADRAHAGDEVDYSAPYMTVEDGKLVTKYPAREHAPGDVAAQAMPADDTDTPGPEQVRARTWLLAVGVPLLGLAAFLILQRNKQGHS